MSDYQPIPSSDPHRLLSSLLYGIAHPWHERAAEDVTRFHSDGAVHPDTGEEALRFPLSTKLLMHEEADVEGDVPAYLSQWVSGPISPLQALKDQMAAWYSQSAADEVQIAWEGQKGTRIAAFDFLPDTVVANARYEQQMLNGGWFDYLPWEPPTGAHDSYDAGVQVSYEGSLWESDVDGNVWEPPTQWTLVQETVGITGDTSSVAGWEPGVDYAVGDQASYDGTIYKCIQAHTSQVGWEPPNVPALWEAV